MDPQATLFDLLQAIEENHREATIEHLDNLTQWLKLGGFMPRVSHNEQYPISFTIPRQNLANNVKEI